MNQERLLELLRKQDASAYNLMYDMYAKSLYAVISNIIRDSGIAEDTLQDTFIKIWKNIHTYDSSKGRFYTWILNIARNAALDKVKSSSYRNQSKNYDIENFVHLVDEQKSSQSRIDAIGLKEFIHKLKPKCIQIIELLFFRGYTQQEASDELKMPLGSVKTLNRTCISDLRDYLKLS